MGEPGLLDADLQVLDLSSFATGYVNFERLKKYLNLQVQLAI